MAKPRVRGLKMPKYGGSMFRDVWLDKTAQNEGSHIQLKISQSPPTTV